MVWLSGGIDMFTRRQVALVAMANLAPDYRWTLVQILRILSVVSVLVDAASCDACDERVSGPSLLQRHRDVEPRPSLAFCKTHKTGRSLRFVLIIQFLGHAEAWLWGERPPFLFSICCDLKAQP